MDSFPARPDLFLTLDRQHHVTEVTSWEKGRLANLMDSPLHRLHRCYHHLDSARRIAILDDRLERLFESVELHRESVFRCKHMAGQLLTFRSRDVDSSSLELGL